MQDQASASTGADRDRYWRAASEILSWPDGATGVARPAAIRSRLRALLRSTRELPDAARPAAARLRRITGSVDPTAIAGSPAALAEDIALIRCVELQREGAAQLVAMHDYVDGADPGFDAELATDRAVALEQLSFVALLGQPHLYPSLRTSFETFRREYARAYLKHHEAYWRSQARLRHDLEAAQPVRRALEGLNSLRALGRPAGVEALQAYESSLAGPAACTTSGIDAALQHQPACPECSLTLHSVPPAGEAKSIVTALEGALARQQRRLASEAVRRILQRGGERIDQFLRIAQASDTAALARVLDGSLLAFLRDLLDEPVTPTAEALDLVEQLAREHPVISEAQLDDVVRTLRRLLADALAAQPAEGSASASIRLGAPGGT